MIASPRVAISIAVIGAVISSCGGSSEGTTGAAAPQALTIRGELDGLHGDRQFPCVFIRTSEGTKVEIAWPNEWSFEDDPPEVSDEAGKVVARAGDELTIDGYWTQIGSGGCGFGKPFAARTVAVVPRGSLDVGLQTAAGLTADARLAIE